MNLLLLSGDFFSNHLSEIELILLILNRIQPSGIMNVILDSSGLLSAVGSTALSKPILATQVLESSAFLHLGTVIAPAGYRKSGTPVMHFEYRLANNQLIEDEVCSGEIKRFELPIGEKVDVHLHAYKGIDIGFGRNGLGGKIKATGGQNGLIVDARGRPVPLSKTKDKKREQIEGWKRSLESEIF